MDPIPTLHEVGRVLVPGGMVGAVWSGTDPEGSFMVQARALLAEQSHARTPAADGANEPGELSSLVMGNGLRATSGFEIPPGLPFAQPDHQVFTWDVALTADDLIGMLCTLSWVITMPDEQRERVLAEARRLLRELLGVAGNVTVDVAFRADAWRSARI